MAPSRRSRRPWTTLIVLVLISITIITFDAREGTHHLVSGVKSIAADVVDPIRTAIDDLLSPLGNFLAGAVHYGTVVHQNQELRAEIGTLRQAGSEQTFDERELRQLLQIDRLPYVPTLPRVTADVIATGTSNYVASIEIDKGRNQGVDVNMPVIGEGGLIGQVVAASANDATIRLVTDGETRISVRFGKNGNTGTVVGTGQGSLLNVEFVIPSTPIHNGEVLYTSSLQGAEFPPGLPVARVRSHRTIPGASQIAITATPVADLYQLAIVDVVQWEAAP